MNMIAVHLSPTFWENPLKFDPDRFLTPPLPGTFMPFGEGPHACIGFKMALIQVKVFVLEFLHAFRSIELAPGQEPIDSLAAVSRRPRNPITVLLRP